MTAACTPRPPVQIAVAADGTGQLRVAVSASGSGNQLRSLRFLDTSNADISVPQGPNGSHGGFTVLATPGATSFIFTVHRTVAGTPVHVPFVVVDDCGEWPTFVGGGPGAF